MNLKNRITKKTFWKQTDMLDATDKVKLYPTIYNLSFHREMNKKYSKKMGGWEKHQNTDSGAMLSSEFVVRCHLSALWCVTYCTFFALARWIFIFIASLCSSSCIAFFIKESTQNYLYFKSHKTFRLEIAWRPVRTKTRPLVKLSDGAVPLPSCLLVNINFIHGKMGFKVCF